MARACTPNLLVSGRVEVHEQYPDFGSLRHIDTNIAFASSPDTRGSPGQSQHANVPWFGSMMIVLIIYSLRFTRTLSIVEQARIHHDLQSSLVYHMSRSRIMVTHPICHSHPQSGQQVNPVSERRQDSN
nr:hypothetical protein CFP56_10025 [Quercus suber]